MHTQAYVFIDLPSQDDAVLAGLAATDGSTGRFVYGKSYLARDDAVALDPINLPLQPDEFIIEGNQGVPAVLLDAGPDNWGRKLMQVLHRQQPVNKLEELLVTQGAGVGALRFSLSRSTPKERPIFPHLHQLTDIHDDIGQLIAQGSLPDDLQRLFEPGSSMGGARPKAVVQDDQQHLWIAKFNRADVMMS